MQNLKNKLEKYILDFPEEKEIAKKFLDILEKKGEKGFFRENIEGHFTGSMVVFNKSLTKTLLMHHKKLDKWLNFGGHSDGDVDLENVAIRELEEEAGIKVNKKDLFENFIDLDLHIIPERKNEIKHFHYDVRFVVLVEDDIFFEKQETEVNDIKWFYIGELEKISSGVWKILKKLIKK